MNLYIVIKVAMTECGLAISYSHIHIHCIHTTHIFSMLKNSLIFFYKLIFIMSYSSIYYTNANHSLYDELLTVTDKIENIPKHHYI